jgi:Helix-turn-helix domain
VPSTNDKAPAPAVGEPLAYRVNDASRISGLGRTTLYKLHTEGKLAMIKVAGRTLIPAESLRALLQVTR